MLSPVSRAYVIAVLLLLASVALAQSTAPAPQPTLTDLQKLTAANFGAEFTVEAIPGSSSPALTGDLDGDGQEDIVMLAHGKDLLAHEEEFRYKVIDPYDSYWGLGDPKVTTRFGAAGDEKDRVLLIIHAWRSQQPRAKFVIINLPFDKLTLATKQVKHKSRAVIQSVQLRVMTSWVVWDGKKYRWQPGDTIDD
jgi:hypothetical protein